MSAPCSHLFTQSMRTVVDLTIHTPMPAVTLAQPAMEPPKPVSLLHSLKPLWIVVVGSIGSPPSFFIGKSSRQRKATTLVALTNLYVLYVGDTTLMTCVTPKSGLRLVRAPTWQCRIAKAYKQHCTRMGGDWEARIRRVDWLSSQTHLVGIEINKSNEAGENVPASHTRVLRFGCNHRAPRIGSPHAWVY